MLHRMDRRDFVYSSLGGALATCIPASALALEQPASQPPAAASIIDSPPVLQALTSDGVTVSIAVSGVSTAWVEYGPTRELGQRADNSVHGMLPLDGRVHRIRILGLKPGDTCFYRVHVAPINFRSAYKIERGAVATSEVRSFRTLDGGRGGRCRVSIINDTHENATTLVSLGKMLDDEADTVVWNGDIFNDVRSDRQIVEQMFRPAGLAYAARSPLTFVSGNHDVRGIHARQLADRFLDTPGGKRYFTFRQGPVAFVVLDTGEDKPDAHPVYAGLNDFARYRDEQAAWLAEAMKDARFREAPFRVALMHIPLFGKAASEDSRAKWHATLAQAGIQLSIHGHVHEHKHSPPDHERPYAQLVGGGPAPESATFIRLEGDEKRMAAIVRDLSGKEVGNFEFKV